MGNEARLGSKQREIFHSLALLTNQRCALGRACHEPAAHPFLRHLPEFEPSSGRRLKTED